MVTAYAREVPWGSRLYDGFTMEPLVMDEEMVEAAVKFLKVDRAEILKRQGAFSGTPQFIYGMMVERDEEISYEVAAIVWGDGAFIFGEPIETTPDGLDFLFSLYGYYRHHETFAKDTDKDEHVTIPMSTANRSRVAAAIKTWESVFEYTRPDDGGLIYRTRETSDWSPLGVDERIRPGPNLDLLLQVVRALPFG